MATSTGRVSSTRAARPKRAAPPVGRASGDPFSMRELAGWLAAGYLVAIVMSWPLLLHLGSQVPQDPADPLAESWEVAWGGHALKTQPFKLFHANAFWPERPSLAFSDSLLGYAPAALVGSGLTAIVVRYNLLFLFAYALAFAGAALLARSFGVPKAAAAVAGMAYAYAPWRLAHNGHLNVLSTGGVPLALALLVSGYRHGRPKRVVAGWLVAAWQVSLGFGMGIYFCYLLLVLAALAAAAWLWRGRPALDRSLARATLAGAALFGGLTLALVVPYLGVLDDHPDARRDLWSVQFYSPPVSSLLAAPVESKVWGERTAVAREQVRWPPEQTLFPGLAVLALAGIGMGTQRVSRGLRAGLALGTAVAVVFSLGLEFAGGRWTYLPLYEHAPGFQGLRTPGRLTFLTSLGLALLAALGAERVGRAASRLAPRATHRHTPVVTAPVLGAAAALLLATVVAAEGSTSLRRADVPRPPAALAGLDDPQYHVPAGAFEDMRYMFWSAANGFPRIGNGNTSFLPRRLGELRQQMRAFPDPTSVAMLRELGYRVVVWHRALAPGTEWQDTANRPTAGLGVTREDLGDVVVYRLTP